MDRGAWWATVHRVTTSQTWLSYLTHSHTHLKMVKMVNFVTHIYQNKKYTHIYTHLYLHGLSLEVLEKIIMNLAFRKGNQRAKWKSTYHYIFFVPLEFYLIYYLVKNLIFSHAFDWNLNTEQENVCKSKCIMVYACMRQNTIKNLPWRFSRCNFQKLFYKENGK